MKCYLLILFVLAFSSCNKQSEYIEIKNSSGKLFKNKGIIVSCFRCSCIDEFLNSVEYHKIKHSDVPVFLDSNCKKKININYQLLLQKNIDSIYLKNYNMLFYKFDSSKNKYVMMIQKTDYDFLKNYQIFFKKIN